MRRSWKIDEFHGKSMNFDEFHGKSMNFVVKWDPVIPGGVPRGTTVVRTVPPYPITPGTPTSATVSMLAVHPGTTRCPAVMCGSPGSFWLQQLARKPVHDKTVFINTRIYDQKP